MSDIKAPHSPWLDGPLLGFDTETTGVNPHEDRLVTAALVWRGERGADGQREQRVEKWLADPGVEIPAAASAVHGVSTQMAREQGRPIEHVLEEVASRLATALAQGVPVVIFNASYDLTLMEAELRRHGLPTLAERLGREIGPILDPLVLDRAVDRWRKGKRNLGSMCEVYGVRPEGEMHAADVDVAATLDVLEALATAYPQVAGARLTELHAQQVASHARWARSFNDWLRSRGRTPDADESWPLASPQR